MEGPPEKRVEAMPDREHEEQAREIGVVERRVGVDRRERKGRKNDIVVWCGMRCGVKECSSGMVR